MKTRLMIVLFWLVYLKGLSQDSLYRATVTKKFDLIHTTLHIQPDWQRQFLNGTAMIRLKPHFYAQEILELDARGFDISGVKMNDKSLKFEYNQNVLKVYLDKKYNKYDTISVSINYVAKPNLLPKNGSVAISSDKGLYFINPLRRENEGMTQLWTQGETQASSCWFPTIDAPNQKSSHDIYITVEDKYLTLSNGKLLGSEKKMNGYRTDHWQQDLPIAPYLFMIAAGEFKKVVDPSFKDFEVSYWVEPEFEKYAMDIFGRTPEMIRFFEKLLGVKYPWAKYAQIAVKEYVSGAMENVSATVHGESIQKNHRQLVDDHDEGVIAHELFHHWFGNLVTCESWSNLPLNESFANYAEYLWINHKYGKEEADMLRYESRDAFQYDNLYLRNHVPLIRFQYGNQEEMFDVNSYNKGGVILHFLRKYVGDEAFFAALKLYLTRNSFKTAEIEDLRMAFEEITGEDLNWFFTQWFKFGGIPSVDASYTYEENRLFIQLKQKQDSTLLQVYKFPLKIWIKGEKSEKMEEIWVDSKETNLQIDFQEKPLFVLFDPEQIFPGTILTPEKSIEELVSIFRNATNVAVRLNALNTLSKIRETDKSIENIMKIPQIKEVFLEACQDKFWRIRQFAVEQFKDYDGEDFLKIERMLQNILQNDARSYVRAEAITSLDKENSFNFSLFRKALKDTSNVVRATALEAILADSPKDSVALVNLQINEMDIENFVVIGNYFSNDASSVNYEWFEKRFKRFSGMDLYRAMGVFSSYLYKLSRDYQQRGRAIFENIARNNSEWQIRLTAIQTLEILSETAEEKQNLKDILKNEKDEKVHNFYNLFGNKE